MKSFNNKIDIHSHYLPPSYLEYLALYEDEQPDSFEAPGWSEEKHIKQMDDCGIAFSFISISSPNLSKADDDNQKSFVRKINKEGAEFADRYPDRIGLIAELPLPNIKNSLIEAAYALDKLNTYGFGLKTHYRGKYLGSEEFDPLMEFLNIRETVIIVHPTAPFHNYAKVNEGVPIPAFEYLVDTTRTFINLVMKDYFNRFPNIKWVFPHGGSFISLISDRFESFLKLMKLQDPLITADFFGAMKQVYFDLAGFPLKKQLPILKQDVPVSHFLYGSDGPYTPAIVTAALAGEIELTDQLSDQEKEMIFARNSVDLFSGLGRKMIGTPQMAERDKKKPCRAKQNTIWKRKLITLAYRRISCKNR